MRKKIIGVYQIRNLINGHLYIGSSIDLTKRLWNHKSFLKHNRHKNKHLQSAWNKYGEDNFVFEVLETLHRKEDAVPTEQIYIDKFNPEYNIAPKAGSTLGYKYTDDDYQKRQNYWTEERRKEYARGRMKENSSMWGHKHSEETKKLMRKKSSGKNNHNYGKPTSKRIKKLISKALSGENSSLAKLTWVDVKEMRRLFSTGKYTKTRLAQIYNISITTASRIINYKTWKEENSNL